MKIWNESFASDSPRQADGTAHETSQAPGWNLGFRLRDLGLTIFVFEGCKLILKVELIRVVAQNFGLH